jgi:hypothetical protein
VWGKKSDTSGKRSSPKPEMIFYMQRLARLARLGRIMQEVERFLHRLIGLVVLVIVMNTDFLRDYCVMTQIMIFLVVINMWYYLEKVCSMLKDWLVDWHTPLRYVLWDMVDLCRACAGWSVMKSYCVMVNGCLIIFSKQFDDGKDWKFVEENPLTFQWLCAFGLFWAAERYRAKNAVVQGGAPPDDARKTMTMFLMRPMVTQICPLVTPMTSERARLLSGPDFRALFVDFASEIAICVVIKGA